MGKAAREQLSRTLNNHLNIIHETFQMMDQAPASSLEKVSWKEVIQMGENVHKQATTVGMLYTGDTPGVKALEENMSAYFNILQGLLLLTHGSTMGAGPTLNSCIHKSIKQVVDSSFMLLQEAVSSYGSPNKMPSPKHSIPSLVGIVWDACSDLKKTPSTNVTAIGRAMTQVAATIKDVLREMRELRPADGPGQDPHAGPTAESPPPPPRDTSLDLDDGDDEGELGNDLSSEEMKTAQVTISAVSGILGVIKELIRSITRLAKNGESVDDGCVVDSLEKLLVACRGIGVEVDELGACLYPPQEVAAIEAAGGKIMGFCDDMETELRKVGGFTEEFGAACAGLRGQLRQLECRVGGCGGEGERERDRVVSGMENLVIGGD